MVRIQAGALSASLALVAGGALVGCGGSDGGPRPARDDLPTVTEGGRVSAPDVAAADVLCRRYQRRPPTGVTEVRIRIAGSPSVTCVVR
ncbi:hypothetical protein [Patulibacter sp.]|uniref:hypothetical protein n=1 Tax=Patulibacter sp. TaxID=1912859 RepID=UPI00272694CF|nr:hypothetical protein [Patulibacter sp.]MDO9408448.1 hypothetical protein [Patulibacter sp.]